jgi:hypothetical protein
MWHWAGWDRVKKALNAVRRILPGGKIVLFVFCILPFVILALLLPRL